MDKEQILTLLNLSFIADKMNIILMNPGGVGKTHLAIALGVAAFQGGYTCYLTMFQNIIQTFRKVQEQNRLLRKLQSFNKPHALIVDEMGYLSLDRNDANLFFQLVSNRYECGSIILTSNKTYFDWGTLFPDEGIAAAILDRLLHYSKTIKISGQSYRLATKKRWDYLITYEKFNQNWGILNSVFWEIQIMFDTLIQESGWF